MHISLELICDRCLVFIYSFVACVIFSLVVIVMFPCIVYLKGSYNAIFIQFNMIF